MTPPPPTGGGKISTIITQSGQNTSSQSLHCWFVLVLPPNVKTKHKRRCKRLLVRWPFYPATPPPHTHIHQTINRPLFCPWGWIPESSGGCSETPEVSLSLNVNILRKPACGAQECAPSLTPHNCSGSRPRGWQVLWNRGRWGNVWRVVCMCASLCPPPPTYPI